MSSPTLTFTPLGVLANSGRWFCTWGSGGVNKSSLFGVNPGPTHDWGYLGFDFGIYENAPRGWLVFIPYWFPLLAFAVPTLYIRATNARWQGQRRRRVGLCERCGYNLTGNVSGTCPECGTATQTPVASAQA